MDLRPLTIFKFHEQRFGRYILMLGCVINTLSLEFISNFHQVYTLKRYRTTGETTSKPTSNIWCTMKKKKQIFIFLHIYFLAHPYTNIESCAKINIWIYFWLWAWLLCLQNKVHVDWSGLQFAAQKVWTTSLMWLSSPGLCFSVVNR